MNTLPKIIHELIGKSPETKEYHEQNQCSTCKNAVWILTKNATFPNSGSMRDYMKFLMSYGETTEKTEGYYRCYCKILCEYQEFCWFDEGQLPHIIEHCSAYKNWLESDDQEKSTKRPTKRPTPTPAIKDNPAP